MGCSRFCIICALVEMGGQKYIISPDIDGVGAEKDFRPPLEQRCQNRLCEPNPGPRRPNPGPFISGRLLERFPPKMLRR